VVANSSPSLTARERLLITLAGVVPDIDGLGAIPDWLTRNSAYPLAWFSTYHHRLHNLAFGLAAAGVSFALARHRGMTGLLALLSFHLHLFEDVLGGRGRMAINGPFHTSHLSQGRLSLAGRASGP
jgi:inner membrane protein